MLLNCRYRTASGECFVLLARSSQPPGPLGGLLPVVCNQAALPQCSRHGSGSVGCRGFCGGGRERGGSPAEGWGGSLGPRVPESCGQGGGGECCFSRLLGCRAVRQERAPSLAASPALGSGTAVRAQRCLLSPAGSGVSTAPLSCEHPVHHSHTPVPLCLFQHRVFVLFWF